MAEQVLMDKDGERMNVPGEKVEAFLADGWKAISREAVAETTVEPKKEQPAKKSKAAEKAAEDK